MSGRAVDGHYLVEDTNNRHEDKTMRKTEQLDFVQFENYCSDKTTTELFGIVNDCQDVLKVWPDHPNHGRYLDQIHVALAEIRKRNN